MNPIFTPVLLKKDEAEQETISFNNKYSAHGIHIKISKPEIISSLIIDYIINMLGENRNLAIDLFQYYIDNPGKFYDMNHIIENPSVISFKFRYKTLETCSIEFYLFDKLLRPLPADYK